MYAYASILRHICALSRPRTNEVEEERRKTSAATGDHSVCSYVEEEKHETTKPTKRYS